MQEQGKHKSLGPKPIIQEQKRQKVLGSTFMEEQGKESSLLDEAKNSVRRGKGGARIIYGSDAQRNLDGVYYRLGDMVWAKVKSHPWWPGQLYDPDLASSSAMEFKRDSCFLVAFFGDSTFGWFAESELIPFEPNFAQKSKQTSARNFVDAVEDALDEVRRRGMLGLTCSCYISKSAPESPVKKPGLLYDRQLHEIRSSFKPAKLVALVKRLACSPLISSQNMLGSTLLQAQAEAFCLRASRKRVLELKETEVLGGQSQSNQIKAHDPNTKTSKDQVVADKACAKKRQPLVSQGQDDTIRADSSKEKLGGLNRVDKVKQHSTSSSPKKGSTKKSEGCHGDKGGIKGTSSKSRGLEPAEDDGQDNRTMSASVSHETLASAVHTLKERDLVESGQNSGQPESHKASAVFDDGIQNAPSLVARDSLATNEKKAPQTKSKKNVGLTSNALTVVVSEVDATESQVLPKKPSVVVKKAKVANMEVDKVLKAKGVKKDKVTNVEVVDKLVKKVKVVNVEMDQVLKAKRMAEDEAIEVLDASSRKTKKRRLLAETVGKGDSNHNLKEDTGGSLASDSMSGLTLQQHTQEIMDVPTGLESQPNVEALMSMETRENLSSETPELVSGVERLQQQETLQDEREGNDAVAPLATGVQLLKQEDQLKAEHKAVFTVQAENTAVIGKKKKKKLRDTHTVELLKSEGLVSNDIEGNTDCSAIRDGEGNTESMETCSKVIKDLTSKDLNPSPIEADSRLTDSHGTGSLQSLVTCSAVEDLLDVSQRKKEVPVYDAQEDRDLIKVVKEKKQLKHLSHPDKVAMSRKRVFEEKDHFSKESSSSNKKMKTVIIGKDGTRHEGLAKKTKGIVQPRDLHEGLMSVAAKPLDAVNEGFYYAVHAAFMNLRKAVYHTGAEGSIASVEDTDAAAPEATNRTGFEICKPSEEDAVLSTERGDRSFEAEILKVAVVRTEKNGTQDVLGGQKGPGEDSFTTPSKLPKKSASFSKKISSSSISLRPAIEAKIPVRGSKDVLNRFGQWVPRRSDDPERMANYPSRIKNGTEERALMITFPQGFLLPSELQLREVFAKFGDLNVPLTKIDFKSGCARIIFRRTQDAEAALSSMKENPVYQNARMWLNPRDADVGELSKQSCKYLSSSEKPVLSRSNKTESMNALDKVETKTTSDKRALALIESDIASDSRIQLEDRSSLPHNPSLRKADDSGKEGAHASFQSKCGVKNAQPSVSTCASKKAPIGEPCLINACHESVDGTLTDHRIAAASSSCPPSVGPMSPMSLDANDISEPFLALLHQLHDLVKKNGFKF